MRLAGKSVCHRRKENTMTTTVESILFEAESLLPESHVAILAREVKRLRERPDGEALQKLLNDAYRKGNQDAHAAREAFKVIADDIPVAWIVGGIEGDHFIDFKEAKTIAAVYGKEPTPLYLHPERGTKAVVPEIEEFSYKRRLSLSSAPCESSFLRGWVAHGCEYGEQVAKSVATIVPELTAGDAIPADRILGEG